MIAIYTSDHSMQWGMNPHTKKSTPTYIGNPHIILGWCNPHTTLGLRTFRARSTPFYFVYVTIAFVTIHISLTII